MASTGSPTGSLDVPSKGRRHPADVNMALKMSPNEGSRAAAAVQDEAWTKHLPTFRRLYVDEGKTLKQVMDFMETEHNFKASYDDSLKRWCHEWDASLASILTAVLRPKMYKQRFRKWGFRKNIRLLEAEDDLSYYELAKARNWRHKAELPSSAVQLANGQVVDLDRLVAHLKRKMLYRRHPQRKITPTYVISPETFYVYEAVLNDTRAYLVSSPKEKESAYVAYTDLIRHNSEGTLPRSLHLY